VEHRRRIVPDSAPRTLGFAEHVLGAWGKELDPDAEMGAHLAVGCSFKDRVRVKCYDRCERARLGVMACMQVFDVQGMVSNSEHASSLDLRKRTHM
jgi:hypothetical protein